MTSSARIVVLGYIIRGPLGGLVWHHLQYVLGLRDLGHDVYFLEDSDDDPQCYDPQQGMTPSPAYGLAFAAQVFEAAGAGDRWGYYDRPQQRWIGPLHDAADEILATADLLINVSGVNEVRDAMASVPVRALVDTDPAFTQIRHLTDPAALARAERHTAFFSFAERIGRDDCTVPADGLPWRPTRQPVVLSSWPVTDGPADGPWTTVMQWESYASRDFRGRTYGMKSASFQPYVNLPAVSGRTLEIALGSPTAPREELRHAGWRVVDPLAVTKTPWTFQDYIRRSKAEFTVAKHGYVVTGSGWFSERSAGYLASGRPVVTQDTGLSGVLPVGQGLHVFSSPEEALSAFDAIDDAYAFHCRAARAVAEDCFDARAVLARLLDQL